MGQILIDVIVVVFVAFAFLLPKATLGLSPAMAIIERQPVEREHLAALEDALFADPTNETIACDLADAYLQLDQSEWALATLSPFAHSAHFRPYLVRATALAERLHAKESVATTKTGLAVCDHDPTCDAAGRTRLSLIGGAMQTLVDQGIEGMNDPARAKVAVAKALRSTKSAVVLPVKVPAPVKAPRAP